MNEERAIKVLQEQIEKYGQEYDAKGIEALEMAIKALAQESITWIVGKDNCQVAVKNMPIDKMQKICAIIGEEEQQPWDCVSRTKVAEILKNNESYFDEVWYCIDLINKVDDLPPVTPQPKVGHWIRWYEQKENDGCIDHIPHCKCSECGKEYEPHSSQFVKYCNKCGAKMEGDK